MKKIFILLIAIYWIILIIAPLKAQAKDILYNCEPTGVAAYLSEKNTWYFEEKYEESTKILDRLETSQLIITDEELYFYKNNPKQNFSYLVPYNDMLEGFQAWKKYGEDEEAKTQFASAILIEEQIYDMDEGLGISEYESLYYVLINYDEKDNLESTSLKRIKFDKKNNVVSEFTFPHDPFPISIYIFTRYCEIPIKPNHNEIDFQEGWNRKIS